MTVDVQLVPVGHCRNSAWLVESGSPFRTLHLPAMVAIIRHQQKGVILFDTGYGQPLLEDSHWAARLYRLLLPFHLGDGIPLHLDRLGLALPDITSIFLSHFHPDHIGSLREMPPVPILHSRTGLSTLMQCNSRQKTHAAFFPALLPDDFSTRARPIEDLPKVQLDASWQPFREGYDVAGDGSLIAIALPGHAAGQFGLLCRRPGGKWVFLVADAAWTRRNIAGPAMPGWPAGALIGDRSAFQATLQQLHELQRRRPEVPLIPSHCQESIEAFAHE